MAHCRWRRVAPVRQVFRGGGGRSSGGPDRPRHGGSCPEPWKAARCPGIVREPARGTHSQPLGDIAGGGMTFHPVADESRHARVVVLCSTAWGLSLIHISEPTRLL